ncbi:MAG: HEAT repeat domain-containing protein [Pyrinomonadaceae bacterium]
MFFIADVFSQPKLVVPARDKYEAAEDNTWWYVMIFLLVAGLGGAIYWYLKDKKSKQDEKELAVRRKKQLSANDNAVDFDSELEWYRKHKNVVNRRSAQRPAKKVSKISNPAGIIGFNNTQGSQENFEKKLENLQFSQLPISRFERLAMARPFRHLPISNDDALLSAIEQTQDEFEEDESVRELAVRILARFETKNSVESLSQVALYDLSSTLRSKAVGILSDFDHESVFETLLLACADPTREVRAAAARGIFRLNFDRADCWMRIAESNDEFRMRHAARAAIAGELVERSFIRLVGNDEKAAFEVMALIVLLIKSGETKEVFEALENHPNQNIRKAILHILKITKEHNALEGLYNLLESDKLSEESRLEIDKLVEEIGLVPA